MFQMRLFYDKYKEEENFVEAIDIKCSNFRKITVVSLKDRTVQEMTTQFLK